MVQNKIDVGHSTRDRYGDKITTDAARLGDIIEPYLFGGQPFSSAWIRLGFAERAPKILSSTWQE